jgi:glycosyltransferase involved in cell wall biosynthesis
VSETERREGLAARTCRPDRTVVIRNGIDPSLFQPRRHERAARPRVVSVGRLKAPKDFTTLLDALARVQGYEAVVVGDGPERAMLQARLESLGIGGSVSFEGERDDVPALLSASDCFVLSSSSEGMPISVLEAMAAGLPVVASDVGGVHELVADGVTGTLVPAGEAAALAAALEPLLADDGLRARMGGAGRAAVEERFTVARVRDEHLALYRRLLG